MRQFAVIREFTLLIQARLPRFSCKITSMPLQAVPPNDGKGQALKEPSGGPCSGPDLIFGFF